MSIDKKEWVVEYHLNAWLVASVYPHKKYVPIWGLWDGGLSTIEEAMKYAKSLYVLGQWSYRIRNTRTGDILPAEIL